MHCDSFFVRFKAKDIIKDLSKLKENFDFSNINESHYTFSNMSTKFIGKVIIEILKRL